MADLRLQRLAQVLVRYSLGLKPVDRLAIQSGPIATPLIREVVREALQAGAHPETFISVPGVQEIIYNEGSNEQLTYIPPSLRLVIEEYEAQLQFASEENTKALSGVDPARIALSQQALRDLIQTYLKRTTDGTLRWCIALYPTNAYAQDADMSQSDFEEFVYRACFLDDEDPAVRWQELSKQQERLVQWLNSKHTIQLRGQDTDVTFSIAGCIFINDDGHYNFPGASSSPARWRIRPPALFVTVSPPPMTGVLYWRQFVASRFHDMSHPECDTVSNGNNGVNLKEVDQ